MKCTINRSAENPMIRLDGFIRVEQCRARHLKQERGQSFQFLVEEHRELRVLAGAMATARGAQLSQRSC
eukprot:COSAG02_NODE_4052_length_5848_cov_2.397982_3_plen_69_part_00